MLNNNILPPNIPESGPTREPTPPWLFTTLGSPTYNPVQGNVLIFADGTIRICGTANYTSSEVDTPFYYQVCTGNFTAIAQITACALQSGFLIIPTANNLNPPGNPQIIVFSNPSFFCGYHVTGGGFFPMAYHIDSGGSATLTSGSSTNQTTAWVKVTRIGSTTTAYWSSNGVSWNSIVSYTDITGSVFVGLSHDSQNSNSVWYESEFNNVSLA